MAKSLSFLLCLLLLLACSDGRQMRMAMERVDSLNRCYISLADDSMMPAVTEWMDRHGSANERMRAHYLLAAVYRDREQAPEALEELHTAAHCADTTVSDCDYRLLSRVHGQMAELLFWQNLPYEMLAELSAYENYARLANDTSAMLEAYSRRADAFDILAEDDSVIAIREKVYDMYRANNDTTGASKAIGALVVLLLERGENQKAGKYLREYESIPGLFDKNGRITSYYNIHYYTKGRYYLSLSQLDSAEHMFKELLCQARNANEVEGGYKGLFLLYKQKHQADSVAKYAELAYQYLDSVYQDDIEKDVQRIHSLYNYDIHKRAAILSKAAERQTRLTLYIVLLFSFFLVSLGIYLLQLQRKKKEAAIAVIEMRHKHRISQMRHAQRDLLTLQEQRYNHLNAEKSAAIHQLQKEIEQYVDLQSHYNPSTLEERLHGANVYRRFKEKVKKPNSIELTGDDWDELRDLINSELPRFFGLMNQGKPLIQKEYDLCVLIRLGFLPKEQQVLLELPPTYNITVFRRRLYEKIFGTSGSARDLDKRIKDVK